MSKAKNLIHKWHEVIESDDLKMLDEIIADDAVFSSPVVFKPMEGKEITMMYLHAAGQSFNMEKFKYTKEIHDKLPLVQYFFALPAYFKNVSIWTFFSSLILLYIAFILFCFNQWLWIFGESE